VDRLTDVALPALSQVTGEAGNTRLCIRSYLGIPAGM